MLDLVHTYWKRMWVCKVGCRGVPTVCMDNFCKHLEEKTWEASHTVYRKLLQAAPEGLTKEETDELRKKGKKLMPICKLARNDVYTSLVNDIRHTFEGSISVKIDWRGLEPSDYKKVGAKLKYFRKSPMSYDIPLIHETREK
ncbi:hypothetical protein V2J09_017056 [Rumex salicifolius]